MSAPLFDPYRAQAQLEWRNRIARWRAQPRESAFHALALLLLAALALPLLRRAPPLLGGALHHALQHAPLALALAGLALATLQHARALQRERRRVRDGWLQVQPAPARLLARRRWHLRFRLLALQALLAGGALWLGGAGATPWGVAAGLLALAPMLAVPLARRLARQALRTRELRARLADPAPGRLWRWQRIAAAAALRGRPLAAGLWALLLVPLGSTPAVVLAVLGGGLLLAVLAGAWRGALGVLPRAAAWLAPQPLTGLALLRATCALPALLLAGTAVLALALMFALGTPALAVPLALALLVPGSLQFAAVYAERTRPRRAALRWALHLLAWLALLQTLAPLALLAWPLQLAWLLRRGARA
jgi:hypothetical protein